LRRNYVDDYFLGYITTLIQLHSVRLCSMEKWDDCVDNRLEAMWKEAVVAYFRMGLIIIQFSSKNREKQWISVRTTCLGDEIGNQELIKSKNDS
jgi:VanZ family protein